jgi:hypothetical protein
MAFPNAGNAGDVMQKSTSFGVKAGIFSPGTYYITDFSYEEFDTDMGISIGGFLDYKLAEKITGGLSFDFGTLGVYEESTSLLDLGVTLKAILPVGKSNIVIRPGAGFGYGTVAKIGEYVESSNYLMLKGLVEAVFATSGELSFLGEIQILGGTSGGNDEYSMAFGPGFLIRGGIAF